jgi:hypothetical protein
MDPTTLWDLTAREVAAVYEGVGLRRRRQHDERMEAVWTGARLAAYPPREPRQFTKLERLLQGPRRTRPKQDWRAQEAILASW